MDGSLKIVTVPAPVLRQPTKKVETFDSSLRNFTSQMEKTIKANKGTGLAAPQVGVGSHVFLMDIADRLYVMINLEILKSSNERSFYKEGCLSFPGVWLEIERPRDVSVRYRDEYGVLHEADFTDWEARCIQHELDHLNGRLFVDGLNKDRRDFIIRKIQKETTRHRADF